jgi:hypothetical protein
MADMTLRLLRAALTGGRSAMTVSASPFVKGMARTSPAERARKRVLDDQEIRDVWKALDVAKVPGCYRCW